MATVDIELYYDIDRRRWTTSAGGLAAQPSLFIGQSNTIDFKVRFVQGGVPIELTNPSFIAGVKVTDDPLGDYLLLTTIGTKTGTGTATIYTFSLNIDSVELQAYLVGITPATNSTAFEVRDTVNNIATLPAITCSILPDYTLTGATPAAASGTLVVDSGATFTVHKTYAMPTDDGTDGFVLKTNGAGVGSWVANTAGAVTSVGQSFTGGIISVSGSPITTSGTLALTVAGTQGGIVYFSSSSGWGSTGSLSLGGLVLGGGTGSPTALLAVASGRVLTSAGTNTSPAYSSTITLGASGTLGTITLGNATSGTILITPPTGALGTVTLTLPITSTTLAGLAVTQEFTAVNTFSSATPSTTIGTGAVVISAGGLGVFGSAYIGGVINLPATTSTAGQITQAGTQFIHSYGTDNLFLGGAGNPTLANMSGTGLNVAIGKSAMAAATTTTGNMAIGKGSLGAITTSASFSNVALGNQCLDQTTTAIEVIAIGNNCQRSMSSQYSVTIGNLANAGNYSVAVGYDALNGTNANAIACVAVGRDAMKLATGERNTACGHSAGSTITTGTYNTLLGEMAQTGSATGTYRTAIGAGAVGTVNNSIKLGRNHTPSVPGDMVILPSVLTANLPTATAAMAGAIIYVSDDGTGHINFCNGSSWARIN